MGIIINETDIKLLNVIQENARISQKTLGRLFNKGATTIGMRLTRLEECGLIKGYVAVLDRAKIDRRQTVYTFVKLRDHGEKMNAFLEAIEAMPEVMGCSQLAGRWDFLLRVIVADIPAYDVFLKDKLFGSSLVLESDTQVVMKEGKQRTAFQLQLGQIRL